MKSLELSRELDRILLLAQEVAKATNSNLELQAEWAKYLCVRVAGFIENFSRELYKDFCRKQCSPAVYRFAAKELDFLQNPKASKLIELAYSFSGPWGNELEQYLNDDGRSEAINSIMSNRHLIAHGKSCTISLVRLKEYLAKIVDVAEYIEDRLNKGISQ